MDLDSLTQQPESLRDEAWERQFLDAILMTNVGIVEGEPKPGPDGWPYLMVRTPAEGAVEPFQRVVKWLAGRGIGLVVNAHKMIPDYVFTYGMLWNFVENGRFVFPQDPTPKGEVVFDPASGSVAGAPSEKYLPSYVRSVLREFLAAQGFAQPKIVIVTSSDYKTTDLVFSTESLGDLPEESHKVLAEALSWFLPLHYNLAFASEQNLPPVFDL